MTKHRKGLDNEYNWEAAIKLDLKHTEAQSQLKLMEMDNKI